MIEITSNKKFIVALILLVFLLSAVPYGVSAEDDGPSVNFCGDEADVDTTADTVKLVFTILSALGPIFGTLFFVGMSVADSATTRQNYKKQRKRVLLLGFGVPVAIAFLETIGNALVTNADISCFFP